MDGDSRLISMPRKINDASRADLLHSSFNRDFHHISNEYFGIQGLGNRCHHISHEKKTKPVTSSHSSIFSKCCKVYLFWLFQAFWLRLKHFPCFLLLLHTFKNYYTHTHEHKDLISFNFFLGRHIHFFFFVLLWTHHSSRVLPKTRLTCKFTFFCIFPSCAVLKRLLFSKGKRIHTYCVLRKCG